jgi:hypothetical protein
MIATNLCLIATNLCLIAINTCLVAINVLFGHDRRLFGQDITLDHPNDHGVIIRTNLAMGAIDHLMIRTNLSVVQANQRSGHVIHSIIASNKWLDREIQRSIGMITDRSCGTYKGRLA